MALLRRTLNIAEREGWIPRNPFRAGEPLINVADEHKRERILSREEEQLLLAACVEQRAHLKAIIICALDTGMRQGEIFKLRGRDVDIEGRTIIIQAFNTKTMRARAVHITERLARELEKLRAMAPPDPNVLVFGIRSNVKRSFEAVRKAAGIEACASTICATPPLRAWCKALFRSPKLRACWGINSLIPPTATSTLMRALFSARRIFSTGIKNSPKIRKRRTECKEIGKASFLLINDQT